MRVQHGFAIGLLLLACVVSAQSIDDLVAGAVAADEDLERLQLARERLDLQYALEDLGPPFALSLGTGGGGLSLQTNGGASGPAAQASGAPALSYTLRPQAVVTVDGDHTITADAAFAGDSDEALALESAGLGYRWELGVLGRTLDDRITDAVRENARLDADQQIRDRERQIRTLVLQRARAVLASEAALVEAAIAVDSAADALDDALALGTVGTGSAAAQELRVGLSRAERIAGRRSLELEEAIRDLRELTGITVTEAPRLVADSARSSEPRAVTGDEPAAGPQYQAALRDYRIAELRYGTEEPDRATLSVNSDYSYAPGRSQQIGPDLPALHTAGGGASVRFGDWSVELGTSIRISEDPDLVPLATTTTLGLTWKLPNAERDRLEARLDSVDLEQAELALRNSEQALTDELQQLVTERRALVERLIRLEEDRELAELRLAEARRRFEVGLVGAELLEEREAAVAELVFDGHLLAYDVALFSLTVEAVTGERE